MTRARADMSLRLVP